MKPDPRSTQWWSDSQTQWVSFESMPDHYLRAAYAKFQRGDYRVPDHLHGHNIMWEPTSQQRRGLNEAFRKEFKRRRHPITPIGSGEAVVTADFRTGPDYPRPWSYHFENGAGSPLLTGSNLDGTGGAFNNALLDALARFPYVTIHGGPFADIRNADIVAPLKARNPRIIIHWYQGWIQQIFYATPGRAWTDLYNATQLRGSTLFAQDGDIFPYASAQTFWNDTSKVLNDFIDIWKNRYILNATPPDRAAGWFMDFCNGKIAGQDIHGSPVDFVRAGYASSGALDDALTAALDTFCDTIKGFGTFVGNGNATSASLAKWDGRLFEGWTSSLFVGSIGLDASLALIAPFMGAGVDGGGGALLAYYDPNLTFSPTWCKGARFTLGSATLYGGYGTARDGGDSITTPDNQCQLWADEYAVSPIADGGVHDPTGTHIGWLGRPIDLPAKDVATGVWTRHFTKGAVLVNGTGSTKVVNMGTQYRRIQGVHDTTVNNGATEQNVSVGNLDAVFLLRLT